jgi:hypothetical protein
MLRLLLDEGFPSPPGFEISAVDNSVRVMALRDLDRGLTGTRTPDWYLYLRAEQEGFDALVTRDSDQLRQAEELWVITKTRLSLITWRKPTYLPEIQRLIKQHGPSLLLLPTPRLNNKHLEKASDNLSILAKERAVSSQQLRTEARQSVIADLRHRGATELLSLLGES